MFICFLYFLKKNIKLVHLFPVKVYENLIVNTDFVYVQF